MKCAFVLFVGVAVVSILGLGAQAQGNCEVTVEVIFNGAGGNSDYSATFDLYTSGPKEGQNEGLNKFEEAARVDGYQFIGTYYPSFDDYFITSIDGQGFDVPNEIWWLLFRNDELTPTGIKGVLLGCDDVLSWRFQAWPN